MKNKKGRVILSFLLAVYTFLLPIAVSADAASSTAVEPTDTELQNSDAVAVLADDVQVGSRIWELFFGSGKKNRTDIMLCPGGDVFGVKMRQKNVTVAEARGIPALSPGDIILSINGKAISSSNDIKAQMSKCKGESVTIRARHNRNEIGVEIRPTLEDGEYKLGLTLRDGAAGIGTMTFIDPTTGLFGGLGHGICDGDSGEIINMQSGEVCGVVLGGVHKGECGKPGELCGILTDEVFGSLTANNECGVFGIITDKSIIPTNTIPIASRDEICEGEATIISTLKNGKTAEYKIEIYDIDKTSDGSKSFRIKVTDPTLKALTGGIVRGMSGSPIIQNGKLVGAVTHVLINDPTTGYGIFIENMLSAAQNQVHPKAA